MNTTDTNNNNKPSLTIEIPRAAAATTTESDNNNASISLQQQATIDQLAHRKRWIDTNIDNGCLTASAFGHALGLKGRIYDYVDYLRQKVGTKDEFRGNSATFHGQRTENTSKMVYEVLCCEGKVVDEGGFYPAITKETGAGHLACSPDGIVSWQEEEEECDDTNNNNSQNSSSTPIIPNFPADFTKSNRRRPKRLLEIKSPIAAIYNGGRADQTPHGIPKAYMCQIQGQIYMTGAEDCDFFVYVAKHPQCLALWRVKPCQTFWDWMLPKLLKFCEFIAVKPKSTPTHEILPKDFKFDDFPDWGCIPVEGIYCPTKLITGSPLKDVKTFPYFFDELKIDMPDSNSATSMVRLRRGKVPDLESQVFHPMMRILAVRGVREGDWVLWRKIKNNTTKTNHENNGNCFCCGSPPPLLGSGRNGKIRETVQEDAAPTTPQKRNSHQIEEEEQDEEMFILRVLTLRPDLNKIEAEIHYNNDQRESMLNLTPSSKLSHQDSDMSSQNTSLHSPTIHQCSICSERTRPITTNDVNNSANTKIIMVEPSVLHDISVIRRKARPVRDEIRYWQEAKQEARERERTGKNQDDNEEKNNDDDTSSRKQQHQEKQTSSSAPSTRKFFTSNSVHLIAQLWNDPIQVLLPSPTCKTFECLEASLAKLRKTIGGNMLKVSPRCAACLWHIVTVFEQENNQKELEKLLATQQQAEQNQQSINDSRSTSPLLPNVNSSSSTSLAGSANSSAASSQQFFHNNNNINNGRKGNINLMNVKSTKELKERIRQARQKVESPRLWVQDSFQLSTICHKVLLGAIRASGSVSQHVLVNQTCAVMTVKVFNHLLDENRFTGHHRRRASPLLPPPNVKTEFNSWIERSSQLKTTKDQQQQQQNHQQPDSQQQQKLRRFEDFSVSSSQQSPADSQSFFPPVASKSTSTSPLFNNNSNNNNTPAFNSSPAAATATTASSMINLSGQNVWETPVWIVCSDHEGEETRVLAERIASVVRRTSSSSSNVVDDDIGEFPDIYRLVEACADRGLDECPWVWFVARK